jgi:hypothetical protein
MGATKRLSEDIELNSVPKGATKKAKNIYQKLSDAKAEIGAISKDSTNPFFKSKYFDINNLLAHVEPILHKHGLLVLQPIIDGKVYTEIINVENGECNTPIHSSLPLTDERDPQKIGSQISYYRRYTLASLLALQAEDDDANSAKPKPQTKPKLEMGTEAFEKVAAYMAKDGKITEVQKKYTLTETIKKILISK